MQCDNSYLSLISGHIDGCNSEIEEKRLQQHLKSCRHCRELLEIMEGNDALLCQDTQQPPANLTERIMTAVAKEPKRQRSRRRFFFTTAAAGLAAAAMLCFAFLGDKLPLLPTKSESAIDDADFVRAENLADADLQHELPEITAEYQGSIPDEESAYLSAEDPGDAPADAPADAPQDEPVVIPTTCAPDVSEDIPQDTQKDIPQDTQKDIPQDTQKDIPNTVDSASEDRIFSFTFPSAAGISDDPLRYGYTSESNIPTLVIWDVQAEELRLPFGATKSEFGIQNSNSGKTGLYEHFYSSLFTLRQPSFIGSDGNKFITPAYNSELYILSYDDLCELFATYTGEYELAVYFPKSPNLDGDCQLILVDTEKTSDKGTSRR